MKKILLALLLTVFFAVPAFSHMMETGDKDKMCDMMSMCIEHADKMGLTDDQVMKMKPLDSEMQKKHARFKADLKIAEIELMEIMDVKDFAIDKAGSAVKKIEEIKTAHHLEMLKAMKDMRTILTDEQFKKMNKMMSIKKTCEKKPEKMMPIKTGEKKPEKMKKP